MFGAKDSVVAIHLSTVLWSIWLHRNAVVFQGVSPDPRAVLHRAKVCVNGSLGFCFSIDFLCDFGDQKEILCTPSSEMLPNNNGLCAICLDTIALQEIALVKGCEHAYCVTCILRWATYNQKPSCPQCKHPFESLNVHRSLDGSINDYMFEESVCLLLRATWFKPLTVEAHEEVYDELENSYLEDVYQYEDDEDDLDEVYFRSSSGIRIGNRRWGDNGYVRAGRREARPVNRENSQDPSAGPSRDPKKKEVKDATGRRAKRALKREAADKAAAEKHQQHLAAVCELLWVVSCPQQPTGISVLIAVSVPVLLHSHNSSVPILNEMNFSDWKIQVQFYLGVLDLDIALETEKPAAITDESSAEEKSIFKA
ncbi:hypothetical protein HHK36_017174 [Tetracentron sinense]|uniref:RING-type domain-containing protein n=1 Tax=Tetracentron sinense TaxID=13715 RepID=A0A834Z200_TETSI|nr:hypothetical protein HHK36_017174 [Tetracentron sinense]